ncbi:hypothetical protein POSPLADRAFT_1157675 [Postia placenta MAD-698-R-SB12]|uniref:F-box domain-containing protein n=1 Tax=Postia placenta MAD-698-R-SB12 TaxID=670580 RepID=A0A1X6MLC0_9APHY|nr:hypothetical protein POSPLADRAFT_1157675 [Postia placenta MAD-698-R-SB12]OSX57155.1 hypothetical protein POSPLADRAFT_1157675 [Postia placenta MAD-698-R-SB12]
MLNQYGDSPNETVAPHQITHSPNPNPRPRRISMADLPDDVLIPIFRQVFNSTGQRKPKTGIQFPESVASVCAQWRAVMFSVSEFWSVLLIATDPDSDKPTPLRGQVENVAPTTGTLEASILESMDIYGGALCQILECGTPMLPKLNEIIIDASYHNGKYTFSLVDFVKLLHKLPLLRTLRCDSVELAPSGDELPPPDLGSPPQIEEVEFTYMNGKDIEVISSCLGRPTVTLAHYKRCDFRRQVELFHTSGSCILTGMFSDTEVLNVLKDWNGPQCSTLHLNDDTSFSEDIIEALAGPLPDGSWICPNLTELILSGNCEGVTNYQSTQQALVDMIKARYALNNSTGLLPQGHPDYVVSSLRRLTVNAEGCVKEIIEADLEWLDANLVSVRWGDWSGGSGEYLKSKSSVEGPDGETSA